ncbi:hypothetical protein OH76DRAFT_594795 [Lentinus brumalis]|uniref:Uncharacterized protein n=1 Tax=Lentinus brumalis TaxID=2498619 RepID=A0A371DU43_9APHY|nr:hypothetical protein OH76DRAFT_594795 [Polyporus brumalis]
MSTICVRCNVSIPAGDTVVDPGCGHTYDVNCLRAMLANVLQGYMAPPHKCCNGHVELSAVIRHLDGGTVQYLRDRHRIIAHSETLRPKWCDHCGTLLALGTNSTTDTFLRCETCLGHRRALMRNSARHLDHTSTE